MTLKLRNNWTKTEGYGIMVREENIIIPSKFKGIQSLIQFKEQYFNFKTGKFKNGTYAKVYKFLQNLGEKTGIDPIKYLYHLYYEQELSTIDIYDRLHSLGGYNNKKKDTFEKMFKKSFGWELRDNVDITEIGKRKIIESNKKLNKTVQNIKKQRQEDLYKIFKNKINVSKLSFHPNDLSKNVLSFSIRPELYGKNQLEKLNSFFEIYGVKDKNISLKDYLLKFKELYGLKNLTDVVNKLLKEKGYDLKLSKGRFSELFKNKYKE